MAYLTKNNQANESISKYKLLSAYGGSGSIIHTQYGSIIISCIEEWGFIKKIISLHDNAINLNESDIYEYVKKQASLPCNGNIGISDDKRLLNSLQERKELTNLKFLALVPSIELTDFHNTVKGGRDNVQFTISSSFMPKTFSDRKKQYKSYNEWYRDWNENQNDKFFPPKKQIDAERTEELVQDNLVLICEEGHISDFPWSRYLSWKVNDIGRFVPNTEIINLFQGQECCGTPIIKITTSSANASGFDGKWLKCESCNRSTSLSGLMSLKINCPGHKPWEANLGGEGNYFGNNNVRGQNPPSENCNGAMRVALTTGNNLYYSRLVSSIYMPDELFLDEITIDINRLEEEKQEAVKNNDFEKAGELQKQIKTLINQGGGNIGENNNIPDSEKEVKFRYDEYKAFTEKDENTINTDEKSLRVKDVTENLEETLKPYFSKILRIDNMKITSAQLDFTRVVPADADANGVRLKNIFRSNPNDVLVYPVIESFGEGVFFAFNHDLISKFTNNNELIGDYAKKLKKLDDEKNNFSEKAIEYGLENNWQLYIVHTFAHLIMRELEFQCGYPSASLSERIYVSNKDNYKMYGCLIYTAEGAEGSMGGVIAQTRKLNLNKLIRNALKRATVCHSDPLCWESEGQGLFNLNFATCFSCGLVSETSCEHRNIYLDRKILVDNNNGFFKDVI